MKDGTEKTKEVWYFSGTGQGEYLAKEICKRSSKFQLKNITSESARQNMKKSMEEKDIIIIYPVYASAPPQPLQDFFKQLVSVNTNVILISL